MTVCLRADTDREVSAESTESVLMVVAAAFSGSAESARAFLTGQKLRCLALEHPCMFFQGSEQ